MTACTDARTSTAKSMTFAFCSDIRLAIPLGRIRDKEGRVWGIVPDLDATADSPVKHKLVPWETVKLDLDDESPARTVVQRKLVLNDLNNLFTAPPQPCACCQKQGKALSDQ